MKSSRGQRQSGFWKAALQFQADKVMPALGIRNAVGVTVPLILGIHYAAINAGLAASIGALLVAYSDNQTPYFQRARRMFAAGVLSSIAVLAGIISASNAAGVVALAGAAAFIAGIAICLGVAVGEVAADVLVALLIFATKSASLHSAVETAALVLAGGLLQILLSLALWPLHRYGPERRVLGDLYLELARIARSSHDPSGSPPASFHSNEAQRFLATLDWARSVESERCRALLSQAERIRRNLLSLQGMGAQLGQQQAGTQEAALKACLELTAPVLESIGHSLHGLGIVAQPASALEPIKSRTEDVRCSACEPPINTIAQQCVLQLDGLVGQLRASIDLASRTIPASFVAPRGFGDRPLRARIKSVVVALLANLNLRSAAFRHAIRLAVCIMVAEALSRSLNLPRSYWVPMTIAIVLKPDFSATFVRGLARLAGTLIGIGLATLLFYLVPGANLTQVAAVAVLTFLLRCFGAANYVIFVIAVTALIVFMLALSGVDPADAIAARGINTAIGGGIALLAYWLCPTWEKHQTADLMADMLEGYRAYFHAFWNLNRADSVAALRMMNRARLNSRLSRSNMEASLTRLRVEPNTTPEQLLLLSGILADTYRLAHSLIAVEARLDTVKQRPNLPAFEHFASDVELTLLQLASSLRVGSTAGLDLPDLRQSHRALELADRANENHDAYLILETDRLTNSLNTLAIELATLISPSESGNEK